jgi:hypothetical protein
MLTVEKKGKEKKYVLFLCWWAKNIFFKLPMENRKSTFFGPSAKII